MGWVAQCAELEEAANLPGKYTSRWRELEPHFEFAANHTGVGRDLLTAVAWVESRWERTAVSPAGARGIMQLMPKTGAAMAKALALDNFDPFDAQQNILAGAEYLRRLVVRYGGKPVDWVYAAYYAGAGNVSKYGPGKYEVYVQRVRKARAAVHATKQRCGIGGGVVPAWPYRPQPGPSSRPAPRPRPSSRPSGRNPAAGVRVRREPDRRWVRAPGAAKRKRWPDARRPGRGRGSRGRGCLGAPSSRGMDRRRNRGRGARSGAGGHPERKTGDPGRSEKGREAARRGGR